MISKTVLKYFWKKVPVLNTEAVAEFFKKKRKENSMTQLDIATKLAISPQAVSKWERGECLPDISLLPEIANIFNIKVEDILNAGMPSDEVPLNEKELFEIMDMLNAFVDDKLFQRVKDEFSRAVTIEELEVPTDIFLFLNNRQKDELLDILLEIDDYITIVDEIMLYINNSQRQKLVRNILQKEDYGNIEPIISFMTNATKTEIVAAMLETMAFDYIEEIMPLIGREQKDIIIEFVFKNNLNSDILENYLTFFDGKQRNLIRKRYEDKYQDK